MKLLMRSASLVLVGVVFGWWIHGVSTTGTHTGELTPTATSGNERVNPSREDIPESAATAETVAMTAFEMPRPPDAASFRQLLDQQAFEKALAYYEQALLIDEAYQRLLRPQLEAYLKSCLQQCSGETFIDLVDIWLSTYYQDIPVLLYLAEHQRMQGLPEEAASTLQIAATYALQAGQRENVDAAVQRLVKSTDENRSRQQSWIELLGFYEYLEIIDLGRPEFLLRQATLYQVIGESHRSRELLLGLRETDNKLNAGWTATLDRLLAGSAPGPAASDRSMHAIAVTRRGDHFLVPGSLNGVDQVVLILDTGASVTSLSSASFARLASAEFEYRGSQVFNTANGLAQARIYRTASIALGDTRIDDIDVAVLDYEPPEGVDGLLGMNVLRNYRFEIDQDKELLYLRPRR